MLIFDKCNTYGWEAAIRGMRNPMNSWENSDSGDKSGCRINTRSGYYIGKNDFALMKKLTDAGEDHAKYMRMIGVTVDITGPLYWWKEYDTYKVGTVANSCSTMHKIAEKEFTIEDFSCEHLIPRMREVLEVTIYNLNACRANYKMNPNKTWWWQMIQLLPSSYNQKRTVQLNYAVLRNICQARKSHKLDEWHLFCEWANCLPCSVLLSM